jgi:LacI family transcriptional regulator
MMNEVSNHMRKNVKLRVAFGFPGGLALTERLQQGILDFAREQGDWTITQVPEMLNSSLAWLRHWPGDGAIVFITTKEDARIARGLSIPIVNLAAHRKCSGIPTVTVDHHAIGRLAAAHLLGLRFQRFAFYGTQGKLYSEQRRHGFTHAVTAAGGECEVLTASDLTRRRTKWTDQEEELDRWLRSFRLPIGLMASTDWRAGMVLDACARLKMRIPEDIAVIGVDNDPIVHQLRQPALSSVSRNDREVGYRAAEMLLRLIRGDCNLREITLIPPDGVVQRHSTDTLAITDPQVSKAVEHIHKHLSEPFGMEIILARATVSRRQLEHRFHASLGCSPYAFICRLRVEKAKRLLCEPEKRTLTDIAAACGFTDLRRFRLVFQRIAGLTAAEYRQMQLHGSL